jgi:hypothetical protein
MKYASRFQRKIYYYYKYTENVKVPLIYDLSKPVIRSSAAQVKCSFFVTSHRGDHATLGTNPKKCR